MDIDIDISASCVKIARGDLLVVGDYKNRVGIYSLKTGDLLQDLTGGRLFDSNGLVISAYNNNLPNSDLSLSSSHSSASFSESGSGNSPLGAGKLGVKKSRTSRSTSLNTMTSNGELSKKEKEKEKEKDKESTDREGSFSKVGLRSAGRVPTTSMEAETTPPPNEKKGMLQQQQQQQPQQQPSIGNNNGVNGNSTVQMITADNKEGQKSLLETYSSKINALAFEGDYLLFTSDSPTHPSPSSPSLPLFFSSSFSFFLILSFSFFHPSIISHP